MSWNGRLKLRQILEQREARNIAATEKPELVLNVPLSAEFAERVSQQRANIVVRVPRLSDAKMSLKRLD